MSARSLGLLAGYLADQLWGDPERCHPVAGFGALAARLERRLYAANRTSGAIFAATLVGATAAAGMAVEKIARRRPILRFLTTAMSTWAVLGGRSLATEAAAVGHHLDAGDLLAARERLTHLVGRDTAQLDESGIARAVIESVAENTSDAVVAPLAFGALAGVPGLVTYRAANTLDAMVGHRNARYAEFGWASARLDDGLNWLPSRLAASLTVGLAPTVGGDPTTARRVWQRDAGAHPSPNAGQIESAFAGALDVTLGGVNQYGGQSEDRHTLGDGQPAGRGDIAAAIHLSQMVGVSSVFAAVVVANRLSRRRRS